MITLKIGTAKALKELCWFQQLFITSLYNFLITKQLKIFAVK
jgi:hypothetical protein